MSQTSPTPITAAPTPAPQRNDRTTFSARVDAFVTWLIAAVTEFNSIATNVYNNAVDAYNNAVAASASATAAEAFSNATLWVSGTTYAAGDVVWSPTDFLNYRRKSDGAGTTDPISDTTNWVSLDNLIDTSVTSNSIGQGAKTFTVSAGKRFQPGMYLVIADTAAPSTNSMAGQVTSYDSITGSLVMSITSTNGSGTKTAWTISQSVPVGTENTANKDISGGYVGKTLEKINFWNTARTYMSFFTNAATAVRTYTFPDKDITVAGLSDLKYVKVRNTCMSGPVDSNGAADFGGSTGTTTVTATGTLIATFANGFNANGQVDTIASITNPSWTGLLTNGTMFLYLDDNGDGTCTTGSGTLAPAYVRGATPSTTSGQFTFDITNKVGYLGNGSTAPQKSRIYVGEVTVAGNVVTAIVWYAINRKYVSAQTAFAALATVMSFSHKLGVQKEANIRADAICITGEYGWTAGQIVTNIQAFRTGTYSVGSPAVGNDSRNACSYTTGSHAVFALVNKTTGDIQAATSANWEIIVTAEGWE
jgi:hypothetical protein